MNAIKSLTLSSALWLTLHAAVAAQVPERINYQGRLVDGTNLVNATTNMVFAFYDLDTGGSPLYAETQTVAVVDGHYSTAIGASNAVPGALSSVLTNNGVYLEITVGGSTLSPRERITAVAYALQSAGVTDEAVHGDSEIKDVRFVGDAAGTTTLDESNTPFDSGARLIGVAPWFFHSSSSNVQDVLDDLDWAIGVASNSAWKLTGNSPTFPGSHFLGTTDDNGLHFKVNNDTVLRIERTSAPVGAFPSFIGGHGSNRVDLSVAAVIAGGGEASEPNVIDSLSGGGSFSAIGGGSANRIGSNGDASWSVISGGRSNLADNIANVIGGGANNLADFAYSTVGGGRGNQARGLGGYDTIAGGRDNLTSNQYTAVGGGRDNQALGQYASIPGGWSNTASGRYSFAAGRQAKANHDGSFVWADEQAADFSSSAGNQFLVRASGGVGIGTATTPEMLTVAGNIAPGLDGTFDLGTPALRWTNLYLSSAVDYGSDLDFINGGNTRMTLTTGGDLSVDGAFMGDGSGLTAVDADTVDGIEGAGLLRSDVNDAADGRILFAGTPTSAAIGGGPVYINPPSANPNDTLLGISVGAVQRMRVNANGDLHVGDGSEIFVTGAGATTFGIAKVGTLTFDVDADDTIFSGDVEIDGDLQVGPGSNTRSYNRLGNGLTGHGLDAADDLLISDDLEVNGILFADGGVAVAGTVVATEFFGGGAGLTGVTPADDSVTGATIADGTITSPDVAPNTFWQTDGNAGTVPGTHFLGTTDDTGLEVHVNGQRALRIEPGVASPMIAAGSSANSIHPLGSSEGSTIGGGGDAAGPNAIAANADFATIGGGRDNRVGDGSFISDEATVSGGSGNTALGRAATVGGGDANAATGSWSAVGGGQNNRAEGNFATISGGDENVASNLYATVGGGSRNRAAILGATVGGGRDNVAIGTNAVVAGGSSNEATNHFATVAGGLLNRAGGEYATIPGGGLNVANGRFSLAAGRLAKADHDGTFVWADTQSGFFTSTSTNQYLVRAGGGVGIGTPITPEMLTVAGNIAPSQNDQFTLGTDSLRWQSLFLNSEIDYSSSLRFVSGVNTAMTVSTVGDVGVAGMVFAASFVGNGATLTSVDADTLDGQQGASYLRSNTSDTYTSGTLTLNPGAILEVNGTLRIGDDSGANDDTIYFDLGQSEFLQWDDSDTRFEFSDDLATVGALQTGSDVDTVGYNRFGTDTTGHFLNNASDVLVSDDLEVNGDLFLDGTDIGVASGMLVSVEGNPATMTFGGQNLDLFLGDSPADEVFTSGDLDVSGTLTKGAGAFLIDHPLDPANQYLRHSFVESPDMKNVYDGVVYLDGEGEAFVTLPEWFEALNRDFRYQLTAVGAPGPDLHVAEEIVGNRFTIAGGEQGMKVSWQVTGIRQDPYANAHRIPVEEMKPPKERGHYLHPGLYGKPEAMSIRRARGAAVPDDDETANAEDS